MEILSHKLESVQEHYQTCLLSVFSPEARQFGGRQFGRKINKNDLPSLTWKRQQKSFVMSQRQLKGQL